MSSSRIIQIGKVEFERHEDKKEVWVYLSGFAVASSHGSAHFGGGPGEPNLRIPLQNNENFDQAIERAHGVQIWPELTIGDLAKCHL